MQDLFPGYYRPSNVELESLWSKGIFVFDTNVLLNLYSYPDAAREAFISVLQRVSGRSWIPYQVALEFHRNRFNRIKQSNKAVHELREKVRSACTQLTSDFKNIEFEKRNTGIDDIDIRLQAVRDAYGSLEIALNLACDRLPSVGLEDPIGQQIAGMFVGRIGQPPADQAELDALIHDGMARFEQKIPPGFGDIAKGDIYRDRGLIYPGKFGDLIIWRQIISHIKKNEHPDIIFITGDRKQDWWLHEGGQVLGPLPELVQEFRSASGAQRFWMYSADQFLKYALEFLLAEEVTPETIAQVKETADLHQQQSFSEKEEKIAFAKRNATLWETAASPEKLGSWLDFSLSDGEHLNPSAHLLWSKRDNIRMTKKMQLLHIEAAIALPIRNWLIQQHPSATVETQSYPNYVVNHPDGRHGFEILKLQNFSIEKISNVFRKASLALEEMIFEKLSIIITMDSDSKYSNDERKLEKLINDIANILYEFPVTSVVFGYIENSLYFELASLHAPRSDL